MTVLEFGDFDWSNGTDEEHLEIARRGSEDQLREIAVSYDWEQHSETVMGWIMAQKCIDLCTALQVFLNAGPKRFNYLPKRNIPDQHLCAVRLLDNICLRINCGFYLPLPGTSAVCRKRASQWTMYQSAGWFEGRKGRWVLDERILESLLNDEMRMELPKRAMPKPRHGLLRSMFMVPARRSS